MLSNAKITAVVPVTNLSRARTFYEDVLELPVKRLDTEHHGFVLYESAGTTLLLYQRATASSGEHTIAGFDLESEFDSIAEKLAARGVVFDTFEVPGDMMRWDDRGVLHEPDGTKSAWFKDPDGNVLNIRSSEI